MIFHLCQNITLNIEYKLKYEDKSGFTTCCTSTPPRVFSLICFNIRIEPQEQSEVGRSHISPPDGSTTTSLFYYIFFYQFIASSMNQFIALLNSESEKPFNLFGALLDVLLSVI